jgi:hypothetical protein
MHHPAYASFIQYGLGEEKLPRVQAAYHIIWPSLIRDITAHIARIMMQSSFCQCSFFSLRNTRPQWWMFREGILPRRMYTVTCITWTQLIYMCRVAALVVQGTQHPMLLIEQCSSSLLPTPAITHSTFRTFFWVQVMDALALAAAGA